MAQPIRKADRIEVGAGDQSSAVLSRHRSPELVIAIVGPVGAGGTRTVESLRRVFTDQLPDYAFIHIKASTLIIEETDNVAASATGANKTLQTVKTLQDRGDELRRSDASAVAKLAVRAVAKRRAELNGQEYRPGKTVEPRHPTVYVIDSIRNPAETHLLRRVYGRAFAQIGVVCEEGIRQSRVKAKYPENENQLTDTSYSGQISEFIERDSSPNNPSYGQRVAKAFHLSDFFLDNSHDDPDDNDHRLDQPIGRFIDIITHNKVVRPTIDETAMHHAFSASMRSACLSRQVGSALVDRDGTIIATGTNEVPRAGGGVYGEFAPITSDPNDTRHPIDHRCAFRKDAHCSNNAEQNDIIDQLIRMLPLEAGVVKSDLAKMIKKTRVGQLIEFSRAVHAEMDAILSAGREGVSTVGTRMFVTTFPCHYCARHIVSAGVYEVQYIEPYPKSLAIKLHDDAITTIPDGWLPPENVSPAEETRRYRADKSHHEDTKVLFRPFVGVAPTTYFKAFEKTRDLKNDTTGRMNTSFESPEWGSEWQEFAVSYRDLEASVIKDMS